MINLGKMRSEIIAEFDGVITFKTATGNIIGSYRTVTNMPIIKEIHPFGKVSLEISPSDDDEL